MVVTASAPLVLRFAGLLWPYGPEQLRLEQSEREGDRSRVQGPGLEQVLLVDPSLPAPVEDEGPLAEEARALRELPPPRPVDLTVHGPRARPGADEVASVLARAALAKLRDEPFAPATPTARALGGPGCWPADASSGEPRPVDPARVAWLDSLLVLFSDLVTGDGDPPPGPSPALLIEAADPDAELARLAEALPGGTPREEELLRRLVAAGLAAHWPLGAGLHLGLCQAGRREELGETLAEYGLVRHPCQLGGELEVQSE